MQIRYINGDLLQTHAPVIVHGCNCQGVMGSGVALQIKNKYPEVFEYYSACTGAYKLGSIIPVRIRDHVRKKNLHVINALTQMFCGRDKNTVYVDYNAVRSCMELVFKYCSEYESWYNEPNNLNIVAMPKIGCGLANGDWNIVSKIVEEELCSKGIEVLVYEL